MGILMGIVLNMYISLGTMDILTILIHQSISMEYLFTCSVLIYFIIFYGLEHIDLLPPRFS